MDDVITFDKYGRIDESYSSKGVAFIEDLQNNNSKYFLNDSEGSKSDSNVLQIMVRKMYFIKNFS